PVPLPYQKTSRAHPHFTYKQTGHNKKNNLKKPLHCVTSCKNILEQNIDPRADIRIRAKKEEKGDQKQKKEHRTQKPVLPV
ncbi:MAG TPA: hypothetical protein VJC03_07875, partial [bacterium]|nr:hypothetical protein [bacterium]